MKLVFAFLLFAAVTADKLRGLTALTQTEPVEGFPIAAENLDFNPRAQPSDFVFDVLAIPGNRGSGGIAQARDSLNTPALIGQGIAITVFTLDVGGQNLIHYHPRATELVFVIKGTIEVGFTTTSGALIHNIVNAGQATLFPRALLHFQRNVGSDTAQYVSILNSENPGTMSFPRSFFTMPTDILAQALRAPLEKVTDIQGRVIPENVRNNQFEGVDGTYDGLAGTSGTAPAPSPTLRGDGESMRPVEGGSTTATERSRQELLRLIQEYLASQNNGVS